jgi:ABC-2 type transport system permease protein
MAVYKRGYQRYQGPVTGHYARLLALPRFAWQQLFQQRLMVALLALSCLWPLLCAVFIYISNHSELWAGLGGGLKNFLQINGRFFLVFMDVQAGFCILLAALAGPGLIAPDLANNALPLYFSRPLTRVDYVLARMITLAGMLSLVTWVPGLALFGMQVGMAAPGWFGNNWYLGGGLVAGFLVWIAIVSMVALASSAYVKWRLIASALILGFFFLLAGAGKMVNGIFRVEWGSLFNPSMAAYSVWCSLLGQELPEGMELGSSIGALAAIVVVLALVLERKLRPVEVIS